MRRVVGLLDVARHAATVGDFETLLPRPGADGRQVAMAPEGRGGRPPIRRHRDGPRLASRDDVFREGRTQLGLMFFGQVDFVTGAAKAKVTRLAPSVPSKSS